MISLHFTPYQTSTGAAELPKTHRTLDPALGGGALLDL